MNIAIPNRGLFVPVRQIRESKETSQATRCLCFAWPVRVGRTEGTWITINNVQPGPVGTDMTAAMMAYIGPKLPLGRIGKPEEIADLVAWLTGPTAGYMTGASLTIDGGWTA